MYPLSGFSAVSCRPYLLSRLKPSAVYLMYSRVYWVFQDTWANFSPHCALGVPGYPSHLFTLNLRHCLLSRWPPPGAHTIAQNRLFSKQFPVAYISLTAYTYSEFIRGVDMYIFLFGWVPNPQHFENIQSYWNSAADMELFPRLSRLRTTFSLYLIILSLYLRHHTQRPPTHLFEADFNGRIGKRPILSKTWELFCWMKIAAGAVGSWGMLLARPGQSSYTLPLLAAASSRTQQTPRSKVSRTCTPTSPPSATSPTHRPWLGGRLLRGSNWWPRPPRPPSWPPTTSPLTVRRASSRQKVRGGTERKAKGSMGC